MTDTFATILAHLLKEDPPLPAFTYDRQQELATMVQSHRRLLESHLDEDELATTRTKGSEPPVTFEDKARAIAESTTDCRARVVAVDLAAFQAAVNVFWTEAIAARVPEHLVRHFLTTPDAARHRDNMPDDDELATEVYFALRDCIIRYAKGTGAQLKTYARQRCNQHLNRYCANRGPVQIPEKPARGFAPSGKIEEDSELTGIEDRAKQWPSSKALSRTEFQETGGTTGSSGRH